jgi:hypothetical protein
MSACPHAGTLEQRPHIGAPPAAGLAGELGLQIRQPDVIGPEVRTDDDGMRAFEISAIDDQQARAVVRSHLPEGDFLSPLHDVGPRLIWLCAGDPEKLWVAGNVITPKLIHQSAHFIRAKAAAVRMTIAKVA